MESKYIKVPEYQYETTDRHGALDALVRRERVEAYSTDLGGTWRTVTDDETIHWLTEPPDKFRIRREVPEPKPESVEDVILDIASPSIQENYRRLTAALKREILEEVGKL